MIARIQWLALTACAAWLLPAGATRADESKNPPKGQRVFSAGHSFHMFIPGILADIARSAGAADHVIAGTSGIGGSRVIQHWDLPEEKNTAKKALRSGKLDVMTMSPIYLPDPGIENFATLALEHNPNIRLFVQESWLPFDLYDPTFKQRPKQVDHNQPTAEDLKKLHSPYFQSIDEHVAQLNRKVGRSRLYVAPVGQAVIALREKILLGQAPGLKEQNDLFTDAIGHAKPPLQALAAYVYYSVIYQRSPAGLPLPSVLRKSNLEERESLNRLLQQLAWETATAHALSGVKASPR